MKTFEQELQEAIDILNNAQDQLESDESTDQTVHVQISEVTEILHKIISSRLNK